MIEFTFQQITELLGQFWWPFIRFTGFFLIAPIFSDKSIPVKIRLGLAFLFAVIVAPMVNNTAAFDPFSLTTLYYTLIELFFGWLIGFISLLFFTAFTMAGQTISVQMGLAMAVMNDPVNGNSEAVIGRFFAITSILLFLSFDAHLLLLSVMVDSFLYWDLKNVLSAVALEEVLRLFTWVVSTALIMAIPAIVVMLFSNTVFGFMTKAAPQLNIFALGFPMTMMLGLIAMSLSISGVGEIFLSLIFELKDQLYYIMELPV